MKRFISVFLCLILCFSIVLPVSASTSASSSFDGVNEFINITSFCEQRKFSVVANSSVTFRFSDLPLGDYVYIDAIVYSNSPITCTNDRVDVINISGSYYRVYGYNSGSSRDYVSFTLENTNAATIYLYKCSVSSSNYLSSRLRGGVSLDNLNGDSDSASTSNNTESVTVSVSNNEATVDDARIQNYYSYFYAYNSLNYDYVDIYLQLIDIYSLDSICVKSNDGYLFPFSINYINVNNGNSVINESYYNNNSITGNLVIDTSFLESIHTVDVCVRIDLSGAYRDFDTDDHKPFVLIKGQRLIGDINTTISAKFVNATGYVNTTGYTTLELYLFRITNYIKDGFSSLGAKLDSIFTGRSEDQTAADSFQDTVDEQASQFEDMSNTMNQVERPDIESIDLSTSNMVDTDAVILATNGIGTILENPIILKVILMALTLALAGFVLYGKR